MVVATIIVLSNLAAIATMIVSRGIAIGERVQYVLVGFQMTMLAFAVMAFVHVGMGVGGIGLVFFMGIGTPTTPKNSSTETPTHPTTKSETGRVPIRCREKTRASRLRSSVTDRSEHAGVGRDVDGVLLQ